MATARKLPSGSWRVQQFIDTVNGKRIYKSFTANTKKEAEYDAAEYVKNYRRMQSPAQLTVGEAMDRYTENKSAILSPETIRGYKKIRKNTLQGIINTRLSDLSQSAIQTAVNEDAKRLSPKSIRNAHGLLSSVIAEFYPDFNLNTKLPQKVKTTISVPHTDVVHAMLEGGKETLVGTIVLLGAVLGLRRSEMCALTWADIDIKGKLLTINKAIVQNDKKEWVLKNPKSYAGSRTVSMPEMAVDYLQTAPRTSDRVVPITPCAASNRFRRFAKKHGTSTRLHDLRHYNASIMLALGVPDKYAMERLGHATPHMLKNVYQHTLSDKQAEIAGQIETFFSNYASRNASR